MRLQLMAVVVALSATIEVQALLIDSFVDGTLVRGPEATNLDLTQSGLSPASVIGGERNWFALYDGSLELNANANGELKLDHDRGIFEVAAVIYGPGTDVAPAAPLNADFTAEGHNQITLRMARSSATELIVGRIPAFMLLNLRSGVGGPNSAGGNMVVRPIISDDAYIIQAPYSMFRGFRPIDFTDIDTIGVSLFFAGLASVTVDEIFTSAGLPGDYNLDGAVNAADYTVWQDNLGENVSLPNENPAASTRGIVDAEDLVFWKSRFGQTFPAAAGGAGGVSAVPEPGTWLMCCLAATLVMAPCRGRMRGW
jgi:hypothetical protein